MQLKMKNASLFIVAVLLCSSAWSAPKITSDETKKLGYCEGVYIYTAQFLQNQNNSGAAINALSRASRVVSANFFLNKEGDVVPGESLATTKAARRTVKLRLDSDPNLIPSEAAECDRVSEPLIKRAINMGGTIFGKSFSEFNQYTLDQYKKTLGL
jgi:hypothetical protein